MQRYRKTGTKRHFRLGITAALPGDFVSMCNDLGIQLDPMDISGGLCVDGVPVGGNSTIEDLQGKWLRPWRHLPTEL